MLISILLPTLNKARKPRTAPSVSPTSASSNCFRIYGANYKDYCPIGFIDEVLQLVRLLEQHQFEGAAHTARGCLLGVGNPSDPRPSTALPKPSLAYMYQPNPPGGGYSENPWPPIPVATSGGHTALGYNCRPEVSWPANAHSAAIGSWDPADKLCWLHPTDTAAPFPVAQLRRQSHRRRPSHRRHLRPAPPQEGRQHPLRQRTGQVGPHRAVIIPTKASDTWHLIRNGWRTWIRTLPPPRSTPPISTTARSTPSALRGSNPDPQTAYWYWLDKAP